MTEASSKADAGASSAVARNTGWNVLGQMVPALFAFAAIPVLIGQLGLERFGVLSLVWIIVGYASLFDFGLGRAMTRSVSARIAVGDPDGARASIATAMVYLAGIGALLGTALAGSVPWVVANLPDLSPQLHSEVTSSVLLLALSLPFVLLTTGFAGALGAFERFKEINLVRMALGVLTFAAPMAAAGAWQRLDAVVGSIVLVRVSTTVAFAALCAKHCGYKLRPHWPDGRIGRELFATGGWMSVSNVIGPLLSYMDRLVLASIVPVKSLPLYTTPHDLLFRTLLVPYALTTALFPRAAGLLPKSEESWSMLERTVRLVLLMTFPVLLVIVVFAEHGLRLWLGDDVAEGGRDVLRILAVGLLCNALAQAPAMLIQANGVPRTMALLHLVELPIFVGVFWTLASTFGVVGAAAAASLRLVGDSVAVFALALRPMQSSPRRLLRAAGWTSGCLALLAGGMFTQSVLSCFVYLAVALSSFGMFAWRHLIEPSDRIRLRAAWSAW